MCQNNITRKLKKMNINYPTGMNVMSDFRLYIINEKTYADRNILLLTFCQQA